MDFHVGASDGYTHKLIEFAQANGHQLTPKQSFDLHQALVDRFGNDYIDIVGNNGQDVYIDHGDIRLVGSGNAQWTEGVPEFIKGWMTQQQLW